MGGRDRQISEFKASLVYRASLGQPGATQRNPVLIVLFHQKSPFASVIEEASGGRPDETGVSSPFFRPLLFPFFLTVGDPLKALVSGLGEERGNADSRSSLWKPALVTVLLL